MAIYHCSIKIISRGKGKSAVAAAAYRAGEQIKNEFDGITHDYTHKGGVVQTEILLPDHAPTKYADRTTLWNAVEKIEKAKNAQLAREIEIALPVELTREQNISLVHEYVKRHFVATGMCADICIHDTGGGNPYAHIMLTMRPFEQGGAWGAKQKKEYILDKDGKKIYAPKKRQYKCKSIPATNWNEQTKAEEWRGAWADCVNAALERGNLNREIEVTNQRLRQLKARIGKLQNWLKEEAANNIMDMAGLDEKFSSMIGEQMDIRDKLKPVERRLSTLKKHIEQADIYMKYKGKKALTDTEQILFTAAHSYLKGVLNGKTTLPTKAWRAERDKLTAEQKTLNQRYVSLKDEVKEAEQIRKSVYSILRQEQRERQPKWVKRWNTK